MAAAVLWEISRHALLWCYEKLSQISTVYGSLTTAIAALLSLEPASTLLLLDAQAIAQYEPVGFAADGRAMPFTIDLLAEQHILCVALRAVQIQDGPALQTAAAVSHRD